MWLAMRASLGCLTLVCFAGQSVADITVYPVKGEVRLYSKAVLGKSGKSLFSEFKKEAKYYGAFYYNAVDDLPWYLNDMPSLSGSQKAAKTRCETASVHKGHCALYAISVPKGFPAKLDGASGLSMIAIRCYKDHYLPNVKSGRYAAFAQSGTGDCGYSYDLGSAVEAEKTALQYCQSALKKGLAGLTKETRQVMKQIGASTCKIVFRNGP